MDPPNVHIVPTILFDLTNRAAYLDAYFNQGDIGGVFVPGHIVLEPGSEVQLEITFLDVQRTFRVRGVVRWRRAQQTRDLEPGVGIEFLATERSTRDLLLDYANGRSVRVLNQRARRLPVRLLVQYTTASAFLTDITEDISEGGLFISSDDPPEVGTPLRLRLKSPGRFFTIKLRGEVAWRQTDGRPGFGVRFIFDKASTEKKVTELVAKLREQVSRGLEHRSPRGRGRITSK